MNAHEIQKGLRLQGAGFLPDGRVALVGLDRSALKRKHFDAQVLVQGGKAFELRSVLPMQVVGVAVDSDVVTLVGRDGAVARCDATQTVKEVIGRSARQVVGVSRLGHQLCAFGAGPTIALRHVEGWSDWTQGLKPLPVAGLSVAHRIKAGLQANRTVTGVAGTVKTAHAVGLDGFLAYRGPKGWLPVNLGRRGGLHGVAADGTGRFYVAGDGVLLHGSKSRWKPVIEDEHAHFGPLAVHDRTLYAVRDGELQLLRNGFLTPVPLGAVAAKSGVEFLVAASRGLLVGGPDHLTALIDGRWRSLV